MARRPQRETEAAHEAWLAKWPVVHGQYRSLVAALSLGAVTGSFACALQTVALVRNVVGTCRWQTAAELLARLTWLGGALAKAARFREPAIANVVRRVLMMVREDHAQLTQQRLAARRRKVATTTTSTGGASSSSSSQPTETTTSFATWQGPSLLDVLAGPGDAASSSTGVAAAASPLVFSAREAAAESSTGGSSASSALDAPPPPGLRQSVVEQILELYEDVEASVEPIASHAAHHVQPSDVVLTVRDAGVADARDDPVAALLGSFSSSSSEHQQQQQQQHPSTVSGVPRGRVVVVDATGDLFSEADPQKSRKKLAYARRVDVTLVPETAIFAIMPKVSKVVLAARAVLADGSFVAPPASYLAALAAREHGVPVLALAAVYKLSPTYPHDPFRRALSDPTGVLPYSRRPEERHVLRDDDGDDLARHTNRPDVANPDFDHVPPDLVDLYITNTGAHQPSYIYRLLAELYSPEDAALFDDAATE